jgi:hypothetical protein
MAHPLELAEPNVIDEELTRDCITTVEEISITEDRKREMKTESELHHVQVASPVTLPPFRLRMPP